MNNDELRLLNHARIVLNYLIGAMQKNPDSISPKDILDWLMIIDDLLDMYD